MSDPTTPGLIAVSIGVLLSFVAVVPFAAVTYARRGEIGFGFGLLCFLFLLTCLALVCYTTLPLPTGRALLCLDVRGPRLQLFGFVGDIVREQRGHSALHLLRNPAALQVALNVLFFVPLGMLLRHLFRRPIWQTVLIGFLVSVAIETTQLTGDWFLYPCPYREFDVDDLAVNTLGALAGALLAPVLRVLPGQRVSGDDDDPRPVTGGRRVLGMVLDVVSVSLIGAGLALGGTLVSGLLAGRVELGGAGSIVTTALPLVAPLAQLAVIMVSEQTIGENIVRLRPYPRSAWWQRLLRWLFGIGGYSILFAIDSTIVGLIWIGFTIASLAAAVLTPTHRGLAYAWSGLHIVDERRIRADGSLGPEPPKRREPPPHLRGEDRDDADLVVTDAGIGFGTDTDPGTSDDAPALPDGAPGAPRRRAGQRAPDEGS